MLTELALCVRLGIYFSQILGEQPALKVGEGMNIPTKDHANSVSNVYGDGERRNLLLEICRNCG